MNLSYTTVMSTCSSAPLLAVVDEQRNHYEGDYESQSQIPEHVASVAVEKNSAKSPT